jgi:uncharacterized membrane protein HdeD (DUF308 family)
MATEIREYLGENWGWIALRGVAAVLFGVVAIGMPGITLATLVILWGAYAVVDGLLAMIAAFRVRDQGRPLWSLLVSGLLGVVAGVLTFRWPGVTALALLTVIAAWAIVIGFFQIVTAIRLRKAIEGEWALGISGALSVIFGVLMVMSPGAGALAVVGIIAAYAIMFGILLIVLGFRLRHLTTQNVAYA